MIVVGLTGSIGMGKTTAAAMFRRMGIPVHDSDVAVHKLYGRGGRAIAAIAAMFPGAVHDGVVDRAALAALVVGNDDRMKALESIVHPLVQDEIERFLCRSAARRARLIILDVPLLFESGRYKLCDAVVVVSAPRFIQRQRALARSGMTQARLDALLDRQMPDLLKRRRADFVVPTGLGRRLTLRRLHEVATRVSTEKRRRHHARDCPRHRNDGVGSE